VVNFRFHGLSQDWDIVATDFGNMILIYKDVSDPQIVPVYTRNDPSMQELDTLRDPDGSRYSLCPGKLAPFSDFW
jgi:hypothetical protein